MDAHSSSNRRPVKRARLLPDESSSDQSEGEGGPTLPNTGSESLTINQEFARRFEHNKKREELHKLQEKYGSNDRTRAHYQGSNSAAAETESDSDSEDEDDEGELVTKDLDAEIFDALNAIRSKDPRVYDKSVNFYRSLPENTPNTKDTDNKRDQKPVHLRDYHRQSLLGDKANVEAVAAPTYPEEQAFAKRDLIQQVQEAEGDDESGSDQEDFFTAKKKQKPKPSGQTVILDTDIETADKDPEGYLSKFMASRAWVPTPNARFHPFESDDEEDTQRADEFEEAYNMRFEDPKKSNEKLISHSREAAAKFSVRRDETKGRKRARQQEREAKEAEKLERDDEKARLRRLKVEEAQEKLERFKKAAGMKGAALPVEKWSEFLEAGWDSDKWDNEMKKRFGDDYYNEDDKLSASEDGDSNDRKKKKKQKVKKPKWDDDIDIGDIVPDFEEQEEQAAKAFRLSDDDDDDDDDGYSSDLKATDGVADAKDGSKKKRFDKKDAEKMRTERKRQARKERQRIEELVDQNMANEILPQASSKRDGQFRYRQTSPTAFGLSARDILMADDSHLNEFAGLKKLASYRDTERKRKDKKKLGKKARLRQWRKDTFGNEDGPTTPFEEYFGSGQKGSSKRSKSNIIDHGPSKKRRRSVKRQIAQGTL